MDAKAESRKDVPTWVDPNLGWSCPLCLFPSASDLAICIYITGTHTGYHPPLNYLPRSSYPQPTCTMSNQMPLPLRAAISVASAALGIGTYIHLGKVMGPFLAPTVKVCFSVKDFSNVPADVQLPRFDGAGIPFVDNFLCMITPFVSLQSIVFVYSRTP